MSETTSDPLEMVPTPALLQELCRRYETFVFVGTSIQIVGQHINRRRINWHGDLQVALALLSQTEFAINARIQDTLQDDPDQEITEGGT